MVRPFLLVLSIFDSSIIKINYALIFIRRRSYLFQAIAWFGLILSIYTAKSGVFACFCDLC